MKISELETLVGISKTNIRFYEREGLLRPGRNSENGYRDYTDDDLLILKRIKLFRKLGLPLEVLHKLQSGALSVEDATRHHVIALQRQKTNLTAIEGVCALMATEQPTLECMDVDRYLHEISLHEERGVRFVNIKKKDIRYIAPVVVTLFMTLVMGGVIALSLWAVSLDPAQAPPLPLLLALLLIPASIIIGVLLALVDRIKEIRGGEEDAAAQY